MDTSTFNWHEFDNFRKKIAIIEKKLEPRDVHALDQYAIRRIMWYAKFGIDIRDPDALKVALVTESLLHYDNERDVVAYDADHRPLLHDFTRVAHNVWGLFICNVLDNTEGVPRAD